MFMGEFSCKVDNKGRFMLPIKFREDLSEVEFVITRGLDNCIDLFPKNIWEEEIVEKRLKKLNLTKRNHRDYQRFILSAATKLTLDNQGRVSLPASLIEHAGIEKSSVVTGSNDHIEIWSEEKWKEYITEKSGIIEDIVDEIEF